MSRLSIFFSAGTVLVAAFWLSGCTPPSDTGPAGSSPSTITAPSGGQVETESNEDEQASGEVGQAAIAEGLALLSEEDRALAEKQKVCPVSGESLGSMGKPVKVEIQGKTVFLCCSGCEDSLKKDPDKYLAKLGQ